MSGWRGCGDSRHRVAAEVQAFVEVAGLFSAMAPMLWLSQARRCLDLWSTPQFLYFEFAFEFIAALL